VTTQHIFLQRLPNCPQLRAINIPNIADHAIPGLEPKEFALQVMDIITLRPEIQLCYLGIMNKCFELLEWYNPDNNAQGDNSSAGIEIHPDVQEPSTDNEDTTDDDDDDDDDDDEGTETVDDEDNNASGADPDETQSEDEDGGDSDDDSFVEEGVHAPRRPRVRLREILFYDDKVAIFKARHGRL
jgi:hypothetical protein